jgi:fermentation-respiration switch protein FrsA (DUF1100 family)
MDFIWKTILAFIFFYLLICCVVYLFQAHLVYFPDRHNFRTPPWPYQNIFFDTQDNLTLNGWLIIQDRSAPTVLFCHGNAGNLTQRIDSIQKFLDMGLNVFIFDYRGYGKSDGKSSEEGTYTDALSAWYYLTKIQKIPAKKIVLFGRSLGSSIAAWLATQIEAGALIIESSFTSMPDLGSTVYPFLPVRLLARYHYPTGHYLGNSKIPKLIIHSRDDEIIPYNFGENNYRMAKEPKKLLSITGSHNEGFLTSGTFYTEGIKSFFAELRLAD